MNTEVGYDVWKSASLVRQLCQVVDGLTVVAQAVADLLQQTAVALRLLKYDGVWLEIFSVQLLASACSMISRLADTVGSVSTRCLFSGTGALSVDWFTGDRLELRRVAEKDHLLATEGEQLPAHLLQLGVEDGRKALVQLS